MKQEGLEENLSCQVILNPTEMKPKKYLGVFDSQCEFVPLFPEIAVEVIPAVYHDRELRYPIQNEEWEESWVPEKIEDVDEEKEMEKEVEVEERKNNDEEEGDDEIEEVVLEVDKAISVEWHCVVGSLKS
ncbi:unnamed protein product [Penicillium glandicola]